MKYYVWLKQKAEGCDYTIGCGQTLEAVEAESFEEAERKVRLWFADEDSDERLYHKGEDTIARAVLFDPRRVAELPVDTWYTEAAQMDAEAVRQEKDVEERQKYEELKARYG